MNPLLDSEFLIQLNNDRNRTIYAHVISLNQYEHPIEQLEGVVTAGSITIDGQSAVRRTCSLTLSAKNLNINNVYWGISTKIKIEIGLQNNILGYENYGDIIWFKQGIFILTDFKTTQTLNNYTINLTGKDKMCLLNGDNSGNLPAPVVFDSYTDASQQSYIIGDSDLFDANSYNSFQDDVAAQAILDGFIERYGSDYQYIRGAQKILSLNFIPKDGNISEDTKIKFSKQEDFVKLKSLLVKDKNNSYVVNLEEKDIYGFYAINCNKGDKFTWVIEQKIPIAIIIQEMLHQFGQERYSNIIIKDIEPYALEMLDNHFGKNFYLLHNGDIYTSLINQEELVNDYKIYTEDGSININEEEGKITNIVFRNYVEEDDVGLVDEQPISYSYIYKDINNLYTVLPVLDDEVAGYGMTLLVYPDELRGEPGDSITSILDKIVNMLGNYEYFYNLDGQFVFQAKPAYLKTAWNGTIYLKDDNYVPASELYKKVAYAFDDAVLTTQYQNTPNMNNIKNDYIIWGERKSLSGGSIKFHGRYAIDNPPSEYTDFNGYTWTTKREDKDYGYNENGKERQYALSYNVDWRELIHIMADDWYANHYKDDYEVELRKNNCWPDVDINLFQYGKTGYEQYYLDFTSIGGCWASIYNIYQVLFDYYTEHPELQQINEDVWNNIQQIIEVEDYSSQFYSSGNYKYWIKDIHENPEKLNYWFDFFKADEMGIGKFAVSVIGDRPKTINDTAIKTIIYRDTPDVIYCSLTEYEYYKKMFALKDGYKYLIIADDGAYNADFIDEILNLCKDFFAKEENQNSFLLSQDNYFLTTIDDNYLTLSDIDDEEFETYNQLLKSYNITLYDAIQIYEKVIRNDLKQNFVRSIRAKTVHDQADDMLYQYSYYNDTVNITAVPIYYLQPNTIISIKDELSKIIGYYIMDKINISLAYNGTMQITSIKAPERIY